MAKCIRCGRQLTAFSLRKICPWCKQHEAIQRGEIVQDDVAQPVIRRPWAVRNESNISLTHILFGANVAVYLAMAIGSGTVDQFSWSRALVRRELWALYSHRPMVAAADVHVHTWRDPAYRI